MSKYPLKPLIWTRLPFHLSTFFIFSFQLDIGGASQYASLNIERMILKKTNVEVKIKAGFGVVGIDVEDPPKGIYKTETIFSPGVKCFIRERENAI